MSPGRRASQHRLATPEGAWLRRLVELVSLTARRLAAPPRLAAALGGAIVVLVGGGWWGYLWWQARPRPAVVTYTVKAPERTEIELPRPLPPHVARVEVCRASGAAIFRTRTVARFADQGFLGRTGAGESLACHPSRAGRHTLRVIDDAGGADAHDVSVEVVP